MFSSHGSIYTGKVRTNIKYILKNPVMRLVFNRVPYNKNVDIYINSPIRLHGVVLH
jgi:hypothetical protein